jgi:endonuclease/exonuclease/phosphatase family metal-dependent hydrolase
MRFARLLLVLACLLVATVLVPAPAATALPADPRCRVAEPPGDPVEPADDGLRVATLNTLHGLDDDAANDYPSAGTLSQRLAMQADQLADAGVDIVGMQEVSIFQKTADQPAFFVAEALAEDLAAATGQRWWSCWFLANPYFPLEPDVSEGGGGPISDFEAQLVSTFTGGPYATFKEGMAVLSRYEIIDRDGIHLPGRVPVEVPLCLVESDPTDPVSGALCAATAGFERRSALWARVRTPVGTVDITTTHLAHGITSGSDASALQQAAVAVAFAESKAAVDSPDHAFFVCDCNSQPADDVPVVGFIESNGWTNTFTVPCDAPGAAGCTAGPDRIVTHDAPARAMFERLDYVFAHAGTCTSGAQLVVDEPVPTTDAHGTGWLFPSDHIGVAADVCA